MSPRSAPPPPAETPFAPPAPDALFVREWDEASENNRRWAAGLLGFAALNVLAFVAGLLTHTFGLSCFALVLGPWAFASAARRTRGIERKALHWLAVEPTGLRFQVYRVNMHGQLVRDTFACSAGELRVLELDDPSNSSSCSFVESASTRVMLPPHLLPTLAHVEQFAAAVERIAPHVTITRRHVRARA